MTRSGTILDRHCHDEIRDINGGCTNEESEINPSRVIPDAIDNPSKARMKGSEMDEGRNIPIVHNQCKSKVACKIRHCEDTLNEIKCRWTGNEAKDHHVRQISTAPDHEKEHERYVYSCLVMTHLFCFLCNL